METNGGGDRSNAFILFLLRNFVSHILYVSRTGHVQSGADVLVGKITASQKTVNIIDKFLNCVSDISTVLSSSI